MEKLDNIYNTSEEYNCEDCYFLKRKEAEIKYLLSKIERLEREKEEIECNARELGSIKIDLENEIKKLKRR